MELKINTALVDCIPSLDRIFKERATIENRKKRSGTTLQWGKSRDLNEEKGDTKNVSLF